ncbi:MAG: hypothetical protein ACKO8G_04855 [Actinomycetota bacterium]
MSGKKTEPRKTEPKKPAPSETPRKKQKTAKGSRRETLGFRGI